MMNIFYILGVVIFGVIEFVGFSYLLKYSFTQFMNHNITIVPCMTFIIFLMWLGKKVSNMTQPTQEDTEDGN